MDALQASLQDQTRSSAPNPNLDPNESQSSMSNFEQAVQAASTTSSSSLHIVSPLIYSEILSETTGHNIFLKMDALQPSGSFKIRGIGRVCQAAVERFGTSAHLVCSSGGNAGLAAATAAKSLGVKCSVYVPETCEEAVKSTLRGLSAEVIVAGPVWDTCDQAARQAVDSEEGAVYVHPFEGEDLVDGHSSIVQEIYDQVAESSQSARQNEQAAVPDLIVSAVGGGGFLAGILRGISNRQSSSSRSAGGQLHRPKVVGVQDFGADGFNQSMNAYHDDPIANAEAHITLPAITSLATSMGARRCSALTLDLARKYARHGTLDDALVDASGAASKADTSTRHGNYFAGVVVEDAISGSATWQFNRDHQIMVEIACGAALAPAYQERLLSKLIKTLPEAEGRKNVVLIACGGSKIDQEMLAKYERDYGLQEGVGRMEVDGKAI